MKCFACFLLIALGTCASIRAEDRPNVIVIFTDDHGWADLGAQGIEDDIRTPHLDALAAGGLRATNGYVTAPQCVPSRAGLLTGRYQNRFGLESNKSSLDGFNTQRTLAERVREAGYVTGMTGKWHLGPAGEITDHGFQDVNCVQGGRAAWSNVDESGQRIAGGQHATSEYHLDANSSAACAFIRQHAKEPFFYYLAHRAPHTPLDAPSKYTARFRGEMPERRRQALAMISAIDDGVGRILQTLRDEGIEDKTLIFFMGDNGAPLKIHKIDSPLNGDAGGWDGSLNAPMNGEKGMLSEGGIRVPWLAYWRGAIPPGQVYSHPVISLDVAATVLALAGQPRDETLDGVDLLPHFTGHLDAAPHERLYWRWIAQSAVRQGPWKLLVGGSRSYLFNLDQDPAEKHNLIEQHPELAIELREHLQSWSQQLQPPGIQTGSMSAVWEEYFDVYLDGKEPRRRVLPANNTPSASRGNQWVARNATVRQEDGAILVTPQQGKHPFIAFSGLQVVGPMTAELLLRVPEGGSLGLSWRLQGQADFVTGQVVHQEVPESDDYQQVSIPVPADGTVIHVRLLLPAGASALQSFEVRDADGRTARRWKFD